MWSRATEAGWYTILTALSVAAALVTVLSFTRAQPAAGHQSLAVDRPLPWPDNPALTYLHRGLKSPPMDPRLVGDNPRLTYLHRGLKPTS
jgi:hypothetical protein